MSIQFDSINLNSSMVGPKHGLDLSEIQAAQPKALDALERFRKSYDQGRYGFPSLPSQIAIQRDILACAASMKGTYDTVCVAGIGGSALGAWALDCGLRGPHPVQAAHTPGNPRLVILDNVDPEFMQQALASMNPARTVVVPIAKSGSTAETMATFLVVDEWMKRALGAKKSSARTIAVTSEGRGDLKAFATANNLATFHIPENVGGRFSVLSAVGLVPAALAGLDIKAICRGAASMTQQSWAADLSTNVALRSALYHHLLLSLRKKSIQVAFPYSNRLWGLAFWFRQLWAESLGKANNRKGKTIHAGQTPVAALGATDQHSQVQLYMEGPNDKVFTFWATKRWNTPGPIPKARTGYESFDYLAGQSLGKLIDAERNATAAALTAASRPNCTYTLDRIDASHLGAFIQMLEFQTAFMGELMGIDAFDQPGVEQGKVFTFGLMKRPGYEAYAETYKAYEKKRSQQ
ncbi:MAG: glucose-6-phosphate isomerase [Bryobacteraceae bacterium]|nr:glucose-6-phosphate isomerase [Bryobacteraceae bacterium]